MQVPSLSSGHTTDKTQTRISVRTIDTPRMTASRMTADSTNAFHIRFAWIWLAFAWLAWMPGSCWSFQATSNSDLANSDLASLDSAVVATEKVTVPSEAPVGLSLPYFLNLAIEQHPSLAAAACEIDVTQFEAAQASLPPNPQLGLFAEEVGNNDSAGLIGAYLQRKVVRGNKLQLARAAKCRTANVLAQVQRQKLIQVETDVRTEFYRLLVAQYRVELAQQLKSLQAQSLETATALHDAAETPRTDLLQSQVQTQRVTVKARQAQIAATAAWRRLATAVAQPELDSRTVTGSLNEVLEVLDFETTLLSILNTSPERQAAVAAVDQSRAELRRELAQAVPDYQTQVSVGQDTSSDDFFAGFQLQVPLMVSDRNQGAIAAARTRITQAQLQIERVELQIARRLTDEFEKYDSAKTQVTAYDDGLLPRARETLELVTAGYGAGEVSFLQVLSAQQSLLNLTVEYLDALETLWIARQKIVGLTLANSLQN